MVMNLLTLFAYGLPAVPQFTISMIFQIESALFKVNKCKFSF